MFNFAALYQTFAIYLLNYQLYKIYVKQVKQHLKTFEKFMIFRRKVGGPDLFM